MTPLERTEAEEFLTNHFRDSDTYAFSLSLENLSEEEQKRCKEIFEVVSFGDKFYKLKEEFNNIYSPWLMAITSLNGEILLYRRTTKFAVDVTPSGISKIHPYLSDGALLETVTAVKAFDLACSKAWTSFIELADTHEVFDNVVTVTEKAIRPRSMESCTHVTV